MCGRSICSLDPYECKRSRRRIRAGQVFGGEESDDYNLAKRLAMKHQGELSENYYLYHGPVKLELPEPKDQLYQKLINQFSFKTCIICNRVLTAHSKVNTSGFGPKVVTNQAVPEYAVASCGDAFHKACLYSYLTELSEQNFITCDKCEILRAYVRIQGWNALHIEVAMDRVKEVRLGDLAGTSRDDFSSIQENPCFSPI